MPVLGYDRPEVEPREAPVPLRAAPERMAVEMGLEELLKRLSASSSPSLSKPSPVHVSGAHSTMKVLVASPKPYA